MSARPIAAYALVASLLSGCGGGGGGSSDSTDQGLQKTRAAVASTLPAVTSAGLEDAPQTGMLDPTVVPSKKTSFSVAMQPAHGSLTVDAATGAFTYIPAPDFNGTDTARFNLRVRKKTTSRMVEFTVTPVNDAPVFPALADATNSPESFETPLPLGIVDVDGDALTITAAVEDEGVATARVDTSGASTLIVTPRVPGRTKISVTVSDGKETIARDMTFTYGPVEKNRLWSLSAPDTQAIQITNTSGGEIEFEWTHTGLPVHATREAMAADVVRTAGASPTSIALWQYVKTNTYHWHPVTDSFWIHDPLVLMNSIGSGFCDDVANTTAILARLLGMQSRVWWLSGHVVAEVQSAGEWQILDPDLAVYYHDASGKVASYDALLANPSLITSPVQPVLPTTASAYWDEIVGLYLSTENNQVIDTDFEGYTRLQGRIALPAGATLTYPGKWSGGLTGSEAGVEFAVPVYAQMKVDLPAGFTGPIDLPFMLWDTAGSGDVTVDGVTYAAGSDAARARLQSWRSLPTGISVSGAGPVTLVYLVNPLRFRMKPSTSLTLKTLEAWALQIDLVTLPEANQAPLSTLDSLRRL